MKTLKIAAAVLVAAALLASCTTFKASGLSYSDKAPKLTVLGDFKTEVWVNGFLGSSAGAKLFNLTADATEGPLKEAIQKAIRDKNGDAAVNVTIEHQASFVDILLNGITSGIYAPGMVIVSGTIVKYE
jgi:ABC-type glycerol-3-phosphate transport system substrate-binding protein